MPTTWWDSRACWADNSLRGIGFRRGVAPDITLFTLKINSRLSDQVSSSNVAEQSSGKDPIRIDRSLTSSSAFRLPKRWWRASPTSKATAPGHIPKLSVTSTNEMIARIAWALTIALPQLCSAAEYSPFHAPDNPFPPGLHLFQRSGKCANSCASLDSDLCCGKKASCARDDAGNIGCCPDRAVCTGIVPGAGSATATPAAGSASAAPGAAITHAIQGTSTLSNQYYPFPVLPTNYADAADCSKSYSSCQAESAKCTGFVEGEEDMVSQCRARKDKSHSKQQYRLCRQSQSAQA